MLAAARIVVAAAAAVAASECPSMEIARSVCRNEQAYFSLNKRVDSFYTCFYADNNKTEPRRMLLRGWRGGGGRKRRTMICGCDVKFMTCR